jgi:hypothetical protein
MSISSFRLAAVALRQRGRDLGRHERRIGQPLQTYEDGAVCVIGLLTPGKFQQQAGLSHPARPSQRDDPHIRVDHQPGQRRQFPLTPDEPRQWSRQVRRRARHHSRRRVREQSRVALKDPLLQLRQRLARLETELGREQAPRTLIGLERIRLAPGSIEGEHQLAPQPLLKLMLTGETFELCQQLSGRTGREIGIEPEQDRLQPLLLKGAAPLGDAPLRRHVAQRLAPKQPQRLGDQRSGLLGIRPGLFDQRIKTPHVELKPAWSEGISSRLEHKQPAKQAPELRQMHVQRRHGARGRMLSPELIDQPVTRDGRTPTQHQQGQQGALTAARQRHRTSVPLEDKRTQNPKTTDVTGHPTTD